MQRELNPLIATLKPQSNGPSHSNTVIGTLAVDGWSATFGTARSGLGGAAARPGPSSLYLVLRRHTIDHEQAAKSAQQSCTCRLRCWLVKPTHLTYCVTFIGYQYVSGWCSRRRHCVTDRAGSANQPTFHWHHTYQPATSDHLNPTSWMNHQPRLLPMNDVTVSVASGTLIRRLSDPLTVTTASRPG